MQFQPQSLRTLDSKGMDEQSSESFLHPNMLPIQYILHGSFFETLSRSKFPMQAETKEYRNILPNSSFGHDLAWFYVMWMILRPVKNNTFTP